MNNAGTHRSTGRNATAHGGTLLYPVFVPSMNRSLSRTSVISKPMHMPTGQVRGSPQSSNGSAPGRDVPSKEILSKTNYSIPQRYRPPSQQRKPPAICAFTKCSATFGNGRAAPTRPTPAIGLHPVHLANTTASSCATSTSCVVARAPRRARTFAEPTAISSNRKNAGSSPESDSRVIHNESLTRLVRPAQPDASERENVDTFFRSLLKSRPVYRRFQV